MWVNPIIAALSFGSVFAALGQILFKTGAVGRVSPLEFVNMWVAGGLVLYAIGTVLWVYALSKANLMLAYPFTVLTFVLVYIAAYFIFGERITATGITGVILILCGMLLIVRAS